MADLRTDGNLIDPDGFYAELLQLHEGREEAESHAINARLILILANHVGDRTVLRQAMHLAAGRFHARPPGAPGAHRPDAGDHAPPRS